MRASGAARLRLASTRDEDTEHIAAALPRPQTAHIPFPCRKVHTTSPHHAKNSGRVGRTCHGHGGERGKFHDAKENADVSGAAVVAKMHFEMAATDSPRSSVARQGEQPGQPVATPRRNCNPRSCRTNRQFRSRPPASSSSASEKNNKTTSTRVLRAQRHSPP